MGLIGLAVVLATRAALGLIGFSSTGIMSGSIAAGLMSTAATTLPILAPVVAAAQHITMIAL